MWLMEKNQKLATTISRDRETELYISTLQDFQGSLEQKIAGYNTSKCNAVKRMKISFNDSTLKDLSAENVAATQKRGLKATLSAQV